MPIGPQSKTREQLEAWVNGVCEEVLEGVSPHIASMMHGVPPRTFARWRAMAEREVEPYYTLFLDIWKAEALFMGEVQKTQGLGEKFLPGSCWILERRDPGNFSLSQHFRKEETETSEGSPEGLISRLQELQERFKTSNLKHPRRTHTTHEELARNLADPVAPLQEGSAEFLASRSEPSEPSKPPIGSESYATRLRARIEGIQPSETSEPPETVPPADRGKA